MVKKKTKIGLQFIHWLFYNIGEKQFLRSKQVKMLVPYKGQDTFSCTSCIISANRINNDTMKGKVPIRIFSVFKIKYTIAYCKNQWLYIFSDFYDVASETETVSSETYWIIHISLHQFEILRQSRAVWSKQNLNFEKKFVANMTQCSNYPLTCL